MGSEETANENGARREGTAGSKTAAPASGAGNHRREIGVLVTILVGLLWLITGARTMDGVPITVAGCLILPNTFYVIDYFRS